MSSRIRDLPEIERFVLAELPRHPEDIVRFTTDRFGISRQAVARHLRRLVEAGLLKATGETKARQYAPAVLRKQHVELPITPDLQEDLVWREHVTPALEGVPDNVL